VIYVENSGEYTVPLAAVAAVHPQKVLLNVAKLDKRLRAAIGHAHDAEDPNIESSLSPLFSGERVGVRGGYRRRSASAPSPQPSPREEREREKSPTPG
jgi:hypothetical protein